MTIKEFCLLSGSTQIEIKKGNEKLYEGSTNHVPKELNYGFILRFYPMYDTLTRDSLNIVYIS